MENHKVNVYEHFNRRCDDEVKRWFSANSHIKWDPVRLEKYADRIDWQVLSSNPNLTANALIFLAFPDKWDWQKVSPRIAAMETKSDFALVASKFKDKLNWNILCRSRHMDSIFVEAFIDYIDWTALCSNPHFIWENLFIERYKDTMNWDSFSESFRPRSFKIIQSMDLHFKNENTLYNWLIGVLKRYDAYWNWNKLSRNTNIGFTSLIVDTFIDKWDWKCLMGNRGFDWSAELLEKYAGYLPELEPESIEISHLWRCLIRQEYLKTCEGDIELLVDNLFED